MRFLTVLVLMLVPVALLDQEVAAVNPDVTLAQQLFGYMTAIPFIGPFVPVLVAFIALAATLAPWLPVGKDGTVYKRIRTFLVDWPGMNFGNAKNKE